MRPEKQRINSARSLNSAFPDACNAAKRSGRRSGTQRKTRREAAPNRLSQRPLKGACASNRRRLRLSTSSVFAARPQTTPLTAPVLGRRFYRFSEREV